MSVIVNTTSIYDRYGTAITDLTECSIGGKYEIRIFFSSTVSLIGGYMNVMPYLFNTSPLTARVADFNINDIYYHIPLAALTTATYIEVPLSNAGNLNLNLKNYQFFYFFNSNTTLSVKLEFIFTEDMMGGLISLQRDNVDRVKKASLYEANDFELTASSVYNSLKYTGISITGYDSASTFFSNVVNIDTTARFYNKGLNGGAVETLNPSIEIKDASGNVVNELSIYEDRTIHFTCDEQAAYTYDNVYCYIYKTSNYNNNLDFIAGLDTSEAEIITSASTATLDKVIKSPSQVMTTAGGVVESFFTTDASLLQYGEKYMIVFVHQITGTVSFYNSFYLDDISCDGDATPLDLDRDITVSYKTWFKESIGKIIEESALAQQNVIAATADKAGYLTAAGVAGSPYTDFDTDFDNLTLTIVNNSTSQTVASFTINKPALGWAAFDGFGDFLKITDDSTSFIANLNTRALFGGGNGVLPTFIGSNIDFIFGFKFSYAQTTSPFSNTYNVTQRVDFATPQCGSGSPTLISTVELFDSLDNPLASGYYYGTNEIKVVVTTNSLPDLEYKFIPYIDKVQFGANLFSNNNMEQENISASVDTVNLPSLTTPKIRVSDDKITGDQGVFYIEPSELDNLAQYRVYVTVHKIV